MRFSKSIVGNSKRAVVFFPFWGATRLAHAGIRALYSGLRKEFTCIYYQYSNDILCEDPATTKENILSVVKDSIEMLKDFCEVALFGASLGCFIALLVASKNSKVKKLVLLTPGISLARAIWLGKPSGLKAIKSAYLKNGMTLQQLEEFWSRISLKQNSVSNNEVLVLASRNDTTLGYNNTEELIDELIKANKVEVVTTGLDHSAAIAKYLLQAPKITNFLLDNRKIYK